MNRRLAVAIAVVALTTNALVQRLKPSANAAHGKNPVLMYSVKAVSPLAPPRKAKTLLNTRV